MAIDVYLFQYNNYFNRTIKKYNTLQEYLDNETLVNFKQNANLFNPNDGINTTFTTPLQTFGGIDYLVATNDNIIMSRWFVVEATRLMNGQYKLTLKRDVIADNFDEIINNADCYIERGWCSDTNSAIYNQESITFNQIKKSQTLMYDKTISPWIVGYIQAPQEDTTIKFETLTNLYQITIPKSIKYASGCPYAIFYMPYTTFSWYKDNTLTNRVSQLSEVSLGLAGEISRQFSGAGILLDLQILPFCPQIQVGYNGGYRSGYIPTFKLDILKNTSSSGTEIAGYMGLITTTPHTTGTIYKQAGGSGTPLTNEILELTINNIKEESSTQMARIVSPNGNGVWEFVPAKQVFSNGSKTGFRFNMTCKPYQPFIKVEPTFGRLYGNNYQDARGMICTGDFSLPQISNAWTTYQIQNKNYEGMFNRQIDSLDLQQKYEKRQDIANMITGTLQGTVGGAMAGSTAGGVGAGIGAAVGLGASLAGGIMDLQANEALRADKRSATIDMHNMSLGNIKAMPNTITKLGSVLADQPLNPYLEIYDCTDDEKENFKKYLSLYSYSINRVGNIKDYLQNNKRTFIRATLIRDEGIKDDSHLLGDIAQELSQGVYIGG